MVLRALLVSEDNSAIAVLSAVLSEFGVTVHSSAHPSGVFSLPQYKLDALLIDFEDHERAISIVETVRSAPFPPLLIALLKDRGLLRHTLSAGANFILYKPVSEGAACATLKAAVALMKRERRRCFRVPVQVAVQVTLEEGGEKEGIILDLSEDGMDILTAEPICPSSRVSVQFPFPEGGNPVEIGGEIAWANPNGQSGMRFVDLSGALQAKFKTFVDSHAQGLLPDDSLMDTKCRLTDLSLGGCYVETESPFPEHSVIQIALRASEMEVSAEGTVRVMHPGDGMGIEFASHTAAHRNEVQALLNLLTSCPGTLPKLQLMPRSLAPSEPFEAETADPLDDPLLDLLRNHHSLNQEQFLHALQQQRNCGEVANA